MPDVIIVGGRIAGSATAMLLARQGVDVLVMDRAGLPSDTISTHQVQLPGGARLRRWGLLDRIVAAGTPPTHGVRFDAGGTVLSGTYPAHEGIDAVHSPRRPLLDGILVDAARESGAEVRDRFTVDELVMADGAVVGVRARDAGGRPITEKAPIVIGADGKHSLVARMSGAPISHSKPNLTAAYYTYYADLPVAGGEIYSRPEARRMLGVWPTNDGLTLVAVFLPIGDFHEFRADLEANFQRSAKVAGDLGERITAARRAERLSGSADNPNVIRKPFGPGWALAGDAGLVMDPVTGYGIGHALRDAELLSTAVVTGLGGSTPLDEALAAYEAERNRQTRPAFDLTTDIAAFGPARPEQEVLYAALSRGPQRDVDDFLSVLTGARPMVEYLNGRNLFRIIGWRGFLSIIANRGRKPRIERHAEAPA
jgi:2-polyprenyl-6-methoxyphenol hydroxylase-like FAD-dependent oxidoreductase